MPPGHLGITAGPQGQMWPQPSDNDSPSWMQDPMPRDLKSRPTKPRRTRSLFKGAALVAAGTLLGSGATIWGLNRFNDGMTPDIMQDSDHNKVNTKVLKISPDYEITYTHALFDVTGTSAVTKYKLGPLPEFALYGAEFADQGAGTPSAVVAKSYKIAGENLQVEDGYERGGKTYHRVVVPVDKIEAETHFIEGRDRLTETDPPASRILGGLVDIRSGVDESTCDLIGKLGVATRQCAEFVTGATRWKENGRAIFQSGVRLAVVNYIQYECTENGWKKADMYAVADGIAEQARLQDIAPDELLVSFVDSNDRETTKAPVFASTGWQEKYDNDLSELSRALPGTPRIEFANQSCDYEGEEYIPEHPQIINRPK